MKRQYPGLVKLIEGSWAEDANARLTFQEIVDALPLLLLEEQGQVSAGTQVLGRRRTSAADVLSFAREQLPLGNIPSFDSSIMSSLPDTFFHDRRRTNNKAPLRNDTRKARILEKDNAKKTPR